MWAALSEAGVADKKAYFVYAYGHYDQSDAKCPVAATNPLQYGACPAATPSLVEDIAAACDAKRNALGAYSLYEPAEGRYAIGAASVPELISGASTDCREYAVTPP